MNRAVLLLCLLTFGCAKYGVSGCASHAVGDWAQVNIPDGCKVKAIAAEKDSGVAILCEDGRVFH